MKILINKKSQTDTIYHILIQILVAVIIYWTLQSYIDSVAKDTLFEKSYLSKDLAFLINTLYAGPGDTKYFYSNERAEINKFEFDFNSQKVSVDETEFKGKVVAEQPYAEDLSSPISSQKISNQNEIAFSKSKNKLDIAKK